jgi:hypothetical protein
MAKTKTKTAAPTAGPTVQKTPDELLKALEAERGGRTLSLGVVTKGMNATQAVMAADPQTQVAFVRHVVGIYAKLGKAKGEWFRKSSVPSAGAEAVRLLLRRKLPFTQDMLAEMFEQMARVNYLSLVEFNEQLAMALEKHAAAESLSPRLKRAAKSFADVLVVRHVSAAKANYWREEWGFPRATDRKTAARIDKVLASAR